jgi:type II pantothenate kinase
MVVGIDIGSTTTKAVAVEDADGAKKIVRMVKASADDPVSSSAGALGKLSLEAGIPLQSISAIMITGVGSSKLGDDIFGIPAKHIGEIQAVGRGGMFLAGRSGIIITNIGTGTAIIDADKGRITHVGGSGVGGGTIIGLGKRLLGLSGYEAILDCAKNGDLGKVDLLMGDIMETNLSFLASNDTASNFGKTLDSAGKEDIALGLFNMVYQVIGVMSMFAARAKGAESVVVTGRGSGNPIGRQVLEVITKLYGVKFEYPQDAEWTTAIGAAIS